MKVIEFFMAMDPPTVTAQEHKVTVINGKPVFYDTPEIKNAKLKLCGYLAKHKPRKRIETGCRLITKWCFPKGATHADGEYRITKPDTDNLQKLLKDCMTLCPILLVGLDGINRVTKLGFNGGKKNWK